MASFLRAASKAFSNFTGPALNAARNAGKTVRTKAEPAFERGRAWRRVAANEAEACGFNGTMFKLGTVLTGAAYCRYRMMSEDERLRVVSNQIDRLRVMGVSENAMSDGEILDDYDTSWRTGRVIAVTVPGFCLLYNLIHEPIGAIKEFVGTDGKVSRRNLPNMNIQDLAGRLKKLAVGKEGLRNVVDSAKRVATDPNVHRYMRRVPLKAFVGVFAGTHIVIEMYAGMAAFKPLSEARHFEAAARENVGVPEFTRDEARAVAAKKAEDTAFFKVGVPLELMAEFFNCGVPATSANLPVLGLTGAALAVRMATVAKYSYEENRLSDDEKKNRDPSEANLKAAQVVVGSILAQHGINAGMQAQVYRTGLGGVWSYLSRGTAAPLSEAEWVSRGAAAGARGLAKTALFRTGFLVLVMMENGKTRDEVPSPSCLDPERLADYRRRRAAEWREADLVRPALKKEQEAKAKAKEEAAGA